jgi:hypothetical protein
MVSWVVAPYSSETCAQLAASFCYYKVDDKINLKTSEYWSRFVSTKFLSWNEKEEQKKKEGEQDEKVMVMTCQVQRVQAKMTSLLCVHLPQQMQIIGKRFGCRQNNI